jgi:predicted Zn-dependent protease
MGKYAEAARALDRSLELNRDDALIWYYSAMARVKLNDMVKAKADLQRVLALRQDWEAGARKEPIFISLFK